MRFYTILKLGPNRELTREGFTIFRNVSVSRIGEQLYGPDEGTGVEPGPDGLIYITRNAEQVFRQETLDSGNGKSLTIYHPDEDVTPDNWRQLTQGMMFNLRRGSGEQKDECVADVMVTTPEALREIDLGLREVSLGYDADYFQLAPGRGEQRNILINHIALVPEGRCGPQCAVRDHKPNHGDCSMKNKKGILDRILTAVRNKDEEGAKKALEEMEEGGENANAGETHIHVHTATPKVEDEPEDPTEKRFKSIEDSIKQLGDSMKTSKDEGAEAAEKEKRERDEEEAKARKAEDADTENEMEEETGTADARKAKDSALLVDSFESVKMLAEIIAPGVKVPTFDAKADPKRTFRDCVCGLRRKALQLATADAETSEMITTVRGRSLDSAEVMKLSCGQVRTIFNGVAAMKRNANNGSVTRDSKTVVTNNRTGDNVTPMERFRQASNARWGIGSK